MLSAVAPLARAPDFARIRAADFSRLDRARHVYLDYTGAALYPEPLVARDADRLLAEVLGNPHSENPASARSTAAMQAARNRVLRFLNADPAEYDVVFAANATAAIRLVGEAYPFGGASRLVLTADNHNSVHGLRAYAAAAGADVEYTPLDAELRTLAPHRQLAEGPGPRLFAYPAQSNFSGVRHPLDWVQVARDLGYHVLLDAAAFVPTSPLDLRRVRPDFVAISFYKMFGYPTGIGALIARREALAMLRRPSFAGGTVDYVSVAHRRHRLRGGAHGFEDGTPHFLGFDATVDGLDYLDGIGMSRIEAHVRRLTGRLLDGLRARGGSSSRIVIHGPATTRARGGTVAFNLLDARGRVVPYEQVELAGRRAGVSIRGGCFCNPGAAERAFGLDGSAALHCLDRFEGRDFSPAGLRRCLAGAPVGAVRASLGVPSNDADVDALLSLIDAIV